MNQRCIEQGMKDRIKINSSWTAYENKILDTTQEGLENEIIFGNENQKTSVISHFAKVEQILMVLIQEDLTYLMD